MYRSNSEMPAGHLLAGEYILLFYDCRSHLPQPFAKDILLSKQLPRTAKYGTWLHVISCSCLLLQLSLLLQRIIWECIAQPFMVTKDNIALLLANCLLPFSFSVPPCPVLAKDTAATLLRHSFEDAGFKLPMQDLFAKRACTQKRNSCA